MVTGGEWKHGVRADMRPGQNIRRQFRVGGGLTRGCWNVGTFHRLHADDRFADRALWNTILNPAGFSAFRMVTRPNPADSYPWRDGDSGRDLVRNSSIGTAGNGARSDVEGGRKWEVASDFGS